SCDRLEQLHSVSDRFKSFWSFDTEYLNRTRLKLFKEFKGFKLFPIKASVMVVSYFARLICFKTVGHPPLAFGSSFCKLVLTLRLKRKETLLIFTNVVFK
ncbi:MAG: hypothetical protein DWQ02_21975, partial [Bacteroidetes bacterium]